MTGLYIYLAILGVFNIPMLCAMFFQDDYDFFPVKPSDLGDNLNRFGQILCYVLAWLFFPIAMLIRLLVFICTR